jgi:predicted amidohydrolase
VRIALGQLESGADIRANLAAIDWFAAEAASDGATLVAFPEYATYEKKKVDATFPAVAEPLDGPVCQELAATARRHRIALVAGVVETSEEPGKAYNTLVAFGPDGEPARRSTGRSTCSTRRVSGSRRSSSRVRPPARWCSSPGERGSA